jgi:glycosyltransferase involved in cell wall biosynthesis
MQRINAILHLSTVLPIPGVKPDNDFLLKIVSEIGHTRSDTTRQKIIRPIPYIPSFIPIRNSKFTTYRNIAKAGGYELDGFKIDVVRHLIWQSPAWRRMILALSVVLNVGRIRKLVKLKPSVVHCHYTFPDLILGLILKKFSRARLVYTIRETDHEDVIRLFRQFPLLLGSVDEITSPSVLIKRRFETAVPRDVKFVPHGLEKAQVAGPGQVSAKSFSGPLQLCSVCRLLRWKNLHVVLKALSRISQQTEFVYTIIGNGPELGHLQQLTGDLGISHKVVFVGYQDSAVISATLDSSHLMLLPSFPETFGRVYFEAMARGVPIVCSRGSGVDGIVVDNVSGFLVAAGEDRELARLIRALDTDRESLRKVGKQGWSIARQWTWGRVVQSFLEGYFPRTVPPGDGVSFDQKVLV